MKLLALWFLATIAGVSASSKVYIMYLPLDKCEEEPTSYYRYKRYAFDTCYKGEKHSCSAASGKYTLVKYSDSSCTAGKEESTKEYALEECIKDWTRPSSNTYVRILCFEETPSPPPSTPAPRSEGDDGPPILVFVLLGLICTLALPVSGWIKGRIAEKKEKDREQAEAVQADSYRSELSVGLLAVQRKNAGRMAFSNAQPPEYPQPQDEAGFKTEFRAGEDIFMRLWWGEPLNTKPIPGIRTPGELPGTLKGDDYRLELHVNVFINGSRFTLPNQEGDEGRHVIYRNGSLIAKDRDSDNNLWQEERSQTLTLWDNKGLFGTGSVRGSDDELCGFRIMRKLHELPPGRHQVRIDFGYRLVHNTTKVLHPREPIVLSSGTYYVTTTGTCPNFLDPHPALEGHNTETIPALKQYIEKKKNCQVIALHMMCSWHKATEAKEVEHFDVVRRRMEYEMVTAKYSFTACFVAYCSPENDPERRHETLDYGHLMVLTPSPRDILTAGDVFQFGDAIQPAINLDSVSDPYVLPDSVLNTLRRCVPAVRFPKY